MQDNRWPQGIVSRLEKVLPITPGAVPMAGMASPIEGAAQMEADPKSWLAIRRDHHGNQDMLKMPDGERFAWELTEAEADAVIAYVQSSHRKPHGQSYWKLSYPKGTLGAFLKASNIRA